MNIEGLSLLLYVLISVLREDWQSFGSNSLPSWSAILCANNAYDALEKFGWPFTNALDEKHPKFIEMRFQTIRLCENVLEGPFQRSVQCCQLHQI